MSRLSLVNYQGCVFTQDTVEALRALRRKATSIGCRLVLHGPKPMSDWQGPLSLAPAGREVHFTLERDGVTPENLLSAAWGVSVPLGFTPAQRYPLLGNNANEYHFLGPWQSLLDSLLADGAGHEAWPSVCAAAQTDVGAWEGDRGRERFVQGQLHRVGRPCGPVDGVLGPRTTSWFESRGLRRSSLSKVMEHLQGMRDPEVPQQESGRGHVVIPGRKIRALGFEGVIARETSHGVSLTISGPGRLVVEVGEEA